AERSHCQCEYDSLCIHVFLLLYQNRTPFVPPGGKTYLWFLLGRNGTVRVRVIAVKLRYSAAEIRKQLSKWGTLWLDGWRTNLLLQRKNLSAEYYPYRKRYPARMPWESADISRK
ncbi:MAG TPA: hypothetical protein VFQ43_12365, partial [Nitrososphaera sp.]|nr:hypothetical protein [Nitrososphaera sp.]